MPLIVKICIALWVVTFIFWLFIECYIRANRFEIVQLKIANKLGECKPLVCFGYLVVVSILLTAFCFINWIFSL